MPNIDISRELEKWFDYPISKLKKEYLIEIINIGPKDLFLKQIADSTPQETIQIIKVTEELINNCGFPDIYDIRVEILDNTPRIAKVPFLDLLKNGLSPHSVYFHPLMIMDFPRDILALGYRIIWFLACVRYDLYLRENPTVRNALIARYTELIENDPTARPFLQNALTELSFEAASNFKNRTKRDMGESQNPNLDKGHYLAREFWGFTHEAAMKAFTGSVEENVAAAVDNDKNKKARMVPLTAYQIAADEEIPGYQNLRKTMQRLREQGKTEEEIEAITEREWSILNPLHIEKFEGTASKEDQEDAFEFVENHSDGKDVFKSIEDSVGNEDCNVESPEEHFNNEGYNVEFSEKDTSGNEIEVIIVKFISNLAPQAASQKAVGEFLIKKIRSGEIDIYIRETKEKNPRLGRFRLDSKKISDDSGIPLWNVERFFKELTKFYRHN